MQAPNTSLVEKVRQQFVAACEGCLSISIYQDYHSDPRVIRARELEQRLRTLEHHEFWVRRKDASSAGSTELDNEFIE